MIGGGALCALCIMHFVPPPPIITKGHLPLIITKVKQQDTLTDQDSYRNSCVVSHPILYLCHAGGVARPSHDAKTTLTMKWAVRTRTLTACPSMTLSAGLERTSMIGWMTYFYLYLTPFLSFAWCYFLT